jgi:hypothetical protein
MNNRSAFNDANYSESEPQMADLASVTYLHSLDQDSSTARNAPLGASTLAAMSNRGGYSSWGSSRDQSDREQQDSDQYDNDEPEVN